MLSSIPAREYTLKYEYGDCKIESRLYYETELTISDEYFIVGVNTQRSQYRDSTVRTGAHIKSPTYENQFDLFFSLALLLSGDTMY